MNRIETLTMLALSVLVYVFALYCGMNHLISAWTMFAAAMFGVFCGVYSSFRILTAFDVDSEYQSR
jgi:hypothetical protein